MKTIHNISERGELIIARVTIHTIGNGDQTDIILREEFFRQLVDLNIVLTQPGKVYVS